MTVVAVLNPGVVRDGPRHVATCRGCAWTVKDASRSKVLRLAAGHVIEQDDLRHGVVVEAVQVDYVTVQAERIADPRLRILRPLPAPSASTSGKPT